MENIMKEINLDELEMVNGGDCPVAYIECPACLDESEKKEFYRLKESMVNSWGGSWFIICARKYNNFMGAMEAKYGKQTLYDKY